MLTEARGIVAWGGGDVGLSCGLSISPTVFARQTWDRFRDEERPLVMDIVREGIAL
jgi:hypothetical protein